MPVLSAPMKTPWQAWCWALGLVALVAVSAAAAHLWQTRERATQRALLDAARPALAQAGGDYYVWVKLIELYPTRLDGSHWDSLADEAPDPYYTLTWQDNTVHTSPTRDNTLIATWDLLAANVWDLLKDGGDVEVATMIRAPLLRIEPGSTATLHVYDADPIGRDTVGQLTVALDTLRVGDNTLALEPTEHNGIRRVVVTLVDRSVTLAELADTVNRR